MQVLSMAVLTSLNWLQGLWKGAPAAVKIFDHRQHGFKEAYEREKSAYSSVPAQLRPRLLGSGLLVHSAAPVIVTTYEGSGISAGQAVPKSVKPSLQQALKVLHKVAAHGAVNCSMFVVRDNVVKLVNFDETTFNPPSHMKSAEYKQMQALLARKHSRP